MFNSWIGALRIINPVAWKNLTFLFKLKNFYLYDMNLVDLHIDRIKALCVKHKVNKLFVFGSVLKESFTSESDIDLVVDFEALELSEYADNYFDFKDQLESLFNRPVDLLEEKGIRNPFLRKQIDTEKHLIYG
jgi:hypothetical protein